MFIDCVRLAGSGDIARILLRQGGLGKTQTQHVSILRFLFHHSEPIELSLGQAPELPRGLARTHRGLRNMIMTTPPYNDHISAVSFQNDFHVETCFSLISPSLPSPLMHHPIHSFSMEDVLEPQITS